MIWGFGCSEFGTGITPSLERAACGLLRFPIARRVWYDLVMLGRRRLAATVGPVAGLGVVVRAAASLN